MTFPIDPCPAPPQLVVAALYIALFLALGTFYGLLTIVWRLVRLRLHRKTTFAPHELGHVKVWGGLNVATALPPLAWATQRMLASASLPDRCSNEPNAIFCISSGIVAVACVTVAAWAWTWSGVRKAHGAI